jgi:multidrug transporter EmrE-like cation transporter
LLAWLLVFIFVIGDKNPAYGNSVCLGAVLVGIIVFNEPKDAMRLVFVGFILVGIIGLKITSSE